MHDDCNKYICWIGATEANSIQDFKRFIFHQLQQFIWLSKCAVPHHPMVTHNTGNQQVLHHLHVDDGSDIIQHIESSPDYRRIQLWQFVTTPIYWSVTSYDVEYALLIGPGKDCLDRVDLGLHVCQVVENFRHYLKIRSVHPLCSRASGNEQWIVKHLDVLKFPV